MPLARTRWCPLPVDHKRVLPGDRLECNVRGRVFTATVRAFAPGGYAIHPDSRNITYYRVTKRQVTGHEPVAFDPSTSQVTR